MNDSETGPGRSTGFQSLASAYARVGGHAPGFDTLRLLAASAVVLHHSLALTHDIVADDWLFAFSHGYTTVGFLAIAVFFCISGFLVTPGLAANGDVIGYLARRFMRLAPLLVVVVVLTVLVVGPLATQLTLDAYFADPRSWLYLKNITTSLSLELPGVVMQDGGNRVNGALWTLRYEVLCYLVLAVLALARLLAKRWAVLALWLGASALTVATYGGQGTSITQLHTLAHLFAYFGAGVLLWLWRTRVPASPLLFFAATALLGAAWAVGAGALLGPLLTAYCVAGLGLVRYPWSARLSRTDMSYGIYLWHGPAMALVLAWWVPGHAPGLFLGTMAMTVPLALASWLLVEKPALARKAWPAQIARTLLARLGMAR